MYERDHFRSHSGCPTDLAISFYQMNVNSDYCVAVTELIETKFLEHRHQWNRYRNRNFRVTCHEVVKIDVKNL